MDGRLFEFTVLSEAQGDDVVVECYDMGATDGGLVGAIRVGRDGRGRITSSDLPIEVLRRWLQVAQSEAGLT